MTMLQRFYPSSECFLIGKVNDEDLFGYIFHGFAHFKVGSNGAYVSFCFNKPQIQIQQTPEIDEIMRQKDAEQSNISGLIRLSTRLKHVQIRYAEAPNLFERVKEELSKTEFKDVITNFKVTIGTLVDIMFPGYNN